MTIKLIPSDSEDIIEVSIDIAYMLPTIKDRVEKQEIIHLHNVKKLVLIKIIDYCKHYLENPLHIPRKSGDVLNPWEKTFLTVNQEFLFDLVTASHDLKIIYLYNICCYTLGFVAEYNIQNIRSNIVYDVLPRKEQEWCEVRPTIKLIPSDVLLRKEDEWCEVIPTIKLIQSDVLPKQVIKENSWCDMTIVKLIPSDCEDEIEVSIDIANMSPTIKNMIDLQGNIPIRLHDVKKLVLLKIIDYCKYYFRTFPHPSRDLKNDMTPWEKTFLTVPQQLLTDLTKASDYLKIIPLRDICCCTVANMIKGRTPEEVRKIFNIEKSIY